MKKIKIIILINVIATIISLIYITYIGKKFNNILYNYINIEVKRVISNVINSSVNDVIINYNTNEIFIEKKDEISMDTKKVNKILKDINKTILEKISKLEEGDKDLVKNSKLLANDKYKKIKHGIICELPVNLIQKNVTLSNIGPSIPIKLSFSGNVSTKTKTSFKNYGINNLVMEVIIIVNIDEQVTMPKSSRETTLTIEAPLVLKIIQGNVPNYYENDLNSNSIMSTKF